MAVYEPPKNDFNAKTGMTFDDANKQANNVIYLKEKADDYENTHKADTTIHKTAEAVRTDKDTAFCYEVRYSDPDNPEVGRAWLRVPSP